MARICSCAVAAIVMSLVLPAQGHAASRRKLCRQAPCHVLIRDGPITVVRAVARATERHPNVEPLLRTVACWRSRDICTWLGDETNVTDEISAHALAVAGRYLAYGLHLEGKEEPDSWRICRLDVATGRLEVMDAPGDFSRLHGGVLSVIATASGAIGWMAAGEVVFPPQGERFVSSDRKVYTLAAHSRTPRLLAS